MWSSFGLENVRFALDLLAGLTFSGVGWLYADAWQGKHRATEFFKFLGFYLVGISFFASAVQVEFNFSTVSIFSSLSPLYLSLVLKAIGYICIIIGLVSDPFPEQARAEAVVPFGFLMVGVTVLPFLASIIALLYLYRATYGREQHLKPVAYGMLGYAFYDLISYRMLFSQTTNVAFYSLMKPYGPFWMLQNLSLIIATAIIGRWIWSYLLKRFQTQLFAIYTVSIVTVFLIITVCFTGLLLSHVRGQAVRTLKSSAQMFSYVLDSKKMSVIDRAQLLAESAEIKDAIGSTSKNKIVESVRSVTDLSNATLMVTNAQGQVIVRGDGREGAQDFFSDDPLVKRALAGKKVASIIEKEGALSPDLMVWGAVPVYRDKALIGVIVVGENLNSVFIDEIRRLTGYEVILYGTKQVSATTISNSLGHSRPVGISIQDPNIAKNVLQENKTYSGDIVFFDSPYLTSVVPLEDIDGVSVGAVGFLIPQIEVLRAAGSSIEYTFLVTALILLISSLPSYLISKYLSSQVK